MPVEYFGFVLLGAAICAVFVLILFKCSKKDEAMIKEYLNNISEENKHLMQNQTYTKTDKKNLFTTNGYVVRSEEKNGNIEAVLLIYSESFDDYYDQKLKIKASDPKAQNIKEGTFLPIVMKYDQDCRLYKYDSLA